jgi:hypothetical protein
MGIMQEMGWAIQQMMVPGLTAFLSMATSKFFENQRSEDETKMSTGQKIAITIRMVSVLGLLFFFVIPKIDDATRWISGGIGGAGLYDLTYRYHSPQTPHTYMDSAPFTVGHIPSNWADMQFQFEVIKGATVQLLKPMETAWSNIWDVIGR